MSLFPNDEDEQDDILKLLDSNDNEDENEGNVTFFPSSDEDEKENDKEENAKEISRRLERLEEENRSLKERSATPAPVYQQMPVYQQNQGSLFPSSNEEAEQAEIDAINLKFANNPGKALLEIYRKGQKDAQEATRKNLYPVAAQNTRFAINQYAATADMDADTKAEFHKLTSTFTPQQLAAAAEDPSTLDKQLDILRKLAWAEAEEKKRKSNSRTNSPPPFAGSSSGRSAGVQMKLSRDQEYAVKLAKSQGFKDKEIMKMIKDGEI